jgi:cobyrinic acid a,c-diamide synthase
MATDLAHGRFPRLLIAGTHSGVGKTSMVIAILGALRRRGVPVQGFKVGPDFIDPMYHREVTGAPSFNLDGWLMGCEGVRRAFARVAPVDEVSIIEGVMGLFDGRATGPEGSSAEVAATVQAPILLVVDVGGMSRSAAALVQGYAHFDPTLRVTGVVLNRVGGERHYHLVKTAIEEQAGVPVWGYLPWDDGLVLPERHLGLVPVGEDAAFQKICRMLAASAERTIDLPAIVAAAQGAPALEIDRDVGTPAPEVRTRVGVAWDAAFNFYYEANLRWLRHWGAEVVECSPLNDPGLPADVDGLYFGGGFPEVFAKGLAENGSFIAALRRAHHAGMPIYAECGGLMYLVEAIQDSAGVRHPMVGLLPGLCRLTNRLQNFGYKEVLSLRASMLGPEGLSTRGHEFHYSVWDGRPPDTSLYRTCSSHGDEQEEGYSLANLTASYVHLHFDACPQVAKSLVDKAADFRRQRQHAFAPSSPEGEHAGAGFSRDRTAGSLPVDPRPHGGRGAG